MPRIRDQKLLDTLEMVPRGSYSGNVWRSVREGRNPLVCSRPEGRWDDGTLDVLYTSETRVAALAERRFHLYQGQPFPPSKVRYEMFELAISLEEVVQLPDLESLKSIGLDVTSFGTLGYLDRNHEYHCSQEIAEACEFLGADGLLVPSAREMSFCNLIVFCDQESYRGVEIAACHGLLEFD